MARGEAGAQAAGRRGGDRGVLRLALPADPGGRAVQLQRHEVAGDLLRLQPALVRRLLPRQRPDRLALWPASRSPPSRRSARSCSAPCWPSASSGSGHAGAGSSGRSRCCRWSRPRSSPAWPRCCSSPGIGLKLSMTTVILAEITFSIAYVTVIVRGRLAGVALEVEEAARDLGCTPFQAAAPGHPADPGPGPGRRRAAGLRAGLRRLRARLLHHRRRPAAAAGAGLLLDPVRRLTRHQRDRHADAARLRPADRGRAGRCPACSTAGPPAWT